MEDRQLLLAEQDYAGTREMLRRVGILAVDQTKSFTVIAIGNALASLVKLVINCKQLDGTTRAFDILAGQVASAVPGAGNLAFLADIVSRVGDIQAKNVGTIDGTLYIKVTDDTGAQIGYWTGSVAVGGVLNNTSVVFAMPGRDYVITVEVGH